MKKRSLFGMAALALACLIMMAIIAVAGSVYSRTAVTFVKATSTATWENNRPYAAVKLARIWIAGNEEASGTVTVKRVTMDGVWTQAVGSVVCTSGAGSTATFTAAYLLPGDKLTFENSATNKDARALIEYEVQQH